VRELFEQKLKDFDLVIFDRFASNALVSNIYLENIARYVQNGGALLEAGGGLAHGLQDRPPEAQDTGTVFMRPPSHDLFDSPLADVLPAAPSGDIRRGDFVPHISQTGSRHPVTRDFDASQKSWGPWQLIEPMRVSSGDIVMEGPDKLPLLILATEGMGPRCGDGIGSDVALGARL